MKFWKMDEKAIRKMVWLNVFLTIGLIPCAFYLRMYMLTVEERARDLQIRVEQFALRVKEVEDER